MSVQPQDDGGEQNTNQVHIVTQQIYDDVLDLGAYEERADAVMRLVQIGYELDEEVDFDGYSGNPELACDGTRFYIRTIDVQTEFTGGGE